MPIPSYDELLHPLLKLAAETDIKRRTAANTIADQLGLTSDERIARLPSGKSTVILNRTGWAMTYLAKGGLISRVSPKTYRITEFGRQFLEDHPDTLTVKDLEAIDGWEAAWQPRERKPRPSGPKLMANEPAGPEMIAREAARSARRRDPNAAATLVEKLYPKAVPRRAALDFFADAIDLAHTLNPNIWGTTLRKSNKITLNVGRVRACGLYADKVWISLFPAAMDPTDQTALERVGTPRNLNQPFSLIPGAVIWWLDPAELPALRASLRAGFERFIELASETSEKVLLSKAHSPGVLRYLEMELRRSLPRPGYASPDDLEAERRPTSRTSAPKAVAVVQPRVQFTERRYDVEGLLKYIELGDIALPDIQRPFVWTAIKVRDLFDSMYRGFPVGSLMLWATFGSEDTKGIGLDEKQRAASLLVVDGQQRLTSLYAVLRGRPVLGDDFREARIEIGFRPRDGAFEVTDAAIRNDPEFISNISELWVSSKPSRRLINEFLEKLRSKRDLSSEDEDAISHNLDRLFDLTKYPFTTLEIAKDVSEEAVADIFVRINNGGSKLGQSDFILTLLAVFSPQTRQALEDFSRRATIPSTDGAASPYNHLIQPAPDQLVRVAIAVGFHRARLSAVYQLLRGKDPDTAMYSKSHRDAQFRRLEEATPKVLNLTYWHLFISCLVGAGFRNAELISSETAVLNSYALYLLGKLQCDVDEKTLSRAISRWFFMASLSGRYTGGSETIMEEDLGRIRDLREPSAFVRILEEMMDSELTHDFWEITLPRGLETSSVNSPAARAYLAAQIKLGAPVLFSDRRIADLYDPAIRANRSAIEGHHLFPRNWLRSKGIHNPKHVNQAANLARVEWPDNADVSDSCPADYVPRLRAMFSPEAWDAMCGLHALPQSWESMPYEEFLRGRRKLMARIIRRGFEALTCIDSAATTSSPFSAADERRAWQLIEELELKLRKTIRDAYDAKWGSSADGRIGKTLGAELSQVESNRSKHLAAYPLSPADRNADLLDYLYLGQLIRLIQSDDIWAEFKPVFKDKNQLQQALATISRVRNDRAHFRPVPEKELQRCVLACDDLLTMIERRAPDSHA